MLIRSLHSSDLEQLRQLAASAEREGFKFPGRLVRELENAAADFSDHHHFFLCVVSDSKIIAIGGVTPDPYTTEEGVGRIRHVYVDPRYRRQSVGQSLLRELEARARGMYSRFTLRTDTEAGARFYESLGYRRVDRGPATHVRP